MTAPVTGTSAILARLRIARAENDLLIAESGEQYLDLFNGSGTVFLGHGHPQVTAAVQAQAGRVWNTGLVSTAIGLQAREAIARAFPAGYRVAALYSTGMEAAEFALRVARLATGRRRTIGLNGSMHGKSMATAFLGWPNDAVTLPDVLRLPSPAQIGEASALANIEAALADRSVAACFIEPLQGSSGGHHAAPAFHQSVARLCSAHGTLLVMDEIFTGFHRTGSTFFHQQLGVSPDVVLVGKAMGNGFPVSAAVVRHEHAITPAMLPSSTYAGNPLAAAAVVATLEAMQQMDMAARVARIERVVVDLLDGLQDVGVPLRGRGALWVLEMDARQTDAVVARLLSRRIVVSMTGRFVRLLPAATIDEQRLADACTDIRDAVRETVIASAGAR